VKYATASFDADFTAPFLLRPLYHSLVQKVSKPFQIPLARENASLALPFHSAVKQIGMKVSGGVPKNSHLIDL